MRVVIDSNGVVEYRDGSGVAISGVAFSGANTGVSPGTLNATSPASASLYTLTEPGFYYVYGGVGATASLPNPSTVPGSTWLISVNAGVNTLQLSGTCDTPVNRCFYMSGSNGATSNGNKLTIPLFGSVALMSAGASYIVLGHSGSISIAS